MDEHAAEKVKADRAVRILIVAMAIGTVLPFALYYFFR